jgi:hypothetical protein
MNVTNVSVAAASPRVFSPAALLGASFVSPAFDYLLIGGVLSLLLVPVLVINPALTGRLTGDTLPVLLLLTSAAHFAASTVRLYTKPGAMSELPFVTMLLPLVSIAVLTLALLSPQVVGPHLQALYLTWSPYHYAAQAYGLAVMYCYRSGCQLTVGEKRALWWIALLPFLRAFVGGANSGLGWFVPREFLISLPVVPGVLDLATRLLLVFAFVLPVAFVLNRVRRKQVPVPLISLCVLIVNGVWWVVLDYIDAFVWATIFHGVQYLAIAAIFHVKDRRAAPDNRHGVAYHTLWFYGMSLALGYGLFYCWPLAYVLAGFGLAESMLLVIAVINIHHFIVDRYIWRLGRDRNYRHVVQVAAPVV